MAPTDELKVFISTRDSMCGECHEQLGRRAWILLAGERGAVSGVRRHGSPGISALGRRRADPPREEALAAQRRRAEMEPRENATSGRGCSSKKRPWPRPRRSAWPTRKPGGAVGIAMQLAVPSWTSNTSPSLPDEFAKSFRTARTASMRSLEFACRKYSGRVGRCAAAKQLDEDAVRLAVIAHVRHVETDYDTLLGRGVDRFDARRRVRGRIEEVLDEWGSRDE